MAGTNYGTFVFPGSGSSGSNASVGTNGSTAPTSSTEVAGINPSGNLQPLQTDNAGNLFVSLNADTIGDIPVNLNEVGGSAFALGQQLAAASLPVVLTSAQLSTLTPLSTVTVIQPTAANLNATVTGTVAATQSGTWNITNISGTVSLPTGAATDAHLTNVQSAVGTSATTAITIQGSATGVSIPTTLSGTVPLPTGAATSALQSTGNTSLASILSDITNGTQITQVSSVPSDTYPATGTITTLDLVTTSNTYSNGQVWYSGTPTAGSAVSFALTNSETGQVEISGVWTGTIQVEISLDGGTNWTAHSLHQIGSPLFIGTFTQNVMGSINLAGKTNVRCRATAAMTGTATIRLNLSANDSSVYVANAMKLVDGSTSTSTTTMTILPASTAAASTNTAVVVAMSPNSIIPAQTGHTLGNAPVLTSYSSTNVTSSAYVQIVASTTNAVNLVELFDSSGQTIYFATGGSGSEVNQFIIYPGGNGQVPFHIAAGTRLSYKATGTSATTGINVLNLYS